MARKTIQFESGRFLEALFCGDRQLLGEIGERYQAKLVARDTDLIIDSEGPAVDAIERLFANLEKARREGLEITPCMVRLAMGGEEGDAAGSGGDLEKLYTRRLLGSAHKPPVVPRNFVQASYLEAMDESTVVFGLGAAGSGKTYLAMARAVAAIEAKEVGRIILTRPAVEAGEALGFLPGDLQEKLSPYLRPLYDALYDIVEPHKVEQMIDRGMIEIAPLAYMRGRTLSNAFVILDEAQNTSAEQMFMFLTRIGIGSRCVVTGDPTQVDLRGGGKTSGLAEAARILEGIEGISFVRFRRQDVIRHPVVERIIEAYGRERGCDPSA
jgi:phosphate starvation-inducible PhoH-like protein